jgi:hypothetical protein
MLLPNVDLQCYPSAMRNVEMAAVQNLYGNYEFLRVDLLPAAGMPRGVIPWADR